jgi:hypothetical protein
VLSRSRRLPSPALVISIFALVVAVGGGTFAFAALNNKKVRKISTSTANKLITKRAGGLSVNHAKSADTATTATNATNATNANTVGGLPPTAFAPSTVVRSVKVSATGVVDANHSDGIVQANVTHPGTGIYCFNGLNPAPKTSVAQFAFGTAFKSEIFSQTNPVAGFFCEGLQIGVATYKEPAVLENEPFEMIIH